MQYIHLKIPRRILKSQKTRTEVYIFKMTRIYHNFDLKKLRKLSKIIQNNTYSLEFYKIFHTYYDRFSVKKCIV